MNTLLITDAHDAIVGMRFSGIESLRVHSSLEMLSALEDALADENIGLVLITETLVAPQYKAVMARRLEETQTMILIIPDPGKSFTDHIATYVRESIGIRF